MTPAEARAGSRIDPVWRWPATITGLLGSIVDTVAGALVLIEVVILLIGVIARFVFQAPLVWSDELASALFLWLAMLGAVIASRRAVHMRMTAVVSAVSPGARAFLDATATLAGAAFLLVMLSPGLEYASDQAFITSPALSIPDVWRAAALPVGAALMLAFALLHLLNTTRWTVMLAAVALVAAVTASLWLASPLLRPLGNANLFLFFVCGVGVMVLAGVPIAFCFGLSTFAFLATTTRVPLTVVIGRMDGGMSQLILLAVPLFVFLGMLLEMTGMAQAMVRFLASLLGHVRGGLSYVLVGAMYLVSGVSGAKAADMAAVAPVLFPEMQRRGSKPGDLVALLAATGAQTETVPPSLVLITVGSVTGVSIGALFTGGLLPSALLALTLCTVVWYRHRDPGATRALRARSSEVARAFVVAVPALVLPFVIRAAVIEGIATATEVSTVGIAYCLIVGPIAYRGLQWRRLAPALVDTAALSGAILLIIGTATAMGWALTQSGFSRSLAVAMGSLPGGRPAFLAVSILAFAVLGSVLEGIPAMVLFGPLLFPIARQVGVNEVHYAMVVVLAMGVGLFAPPFGVGYYAACAISQVSPDAGMRSIWGYLLALIIGLTIVAAVPWLSTGFL